MLAHYFISFFFYFTSISPFAKGSFFEAYFSNFIEGTEFEVAEESDIIFRGRLFPERPEDAHDILETYQLVSSIDEMSKSYANFDEFISLLKARHLKFMSSRTDKKLGEFKDRVNRAGVTTFVDLELVTGTLLKGFELIRQLRGLLQRLNLHGVIFATWPLILGDKIMDYTEKEENPPSFWHSYF